MVSGESWNLSTPIRVEKSITKSITNSNLKNQLQLNIYFIVNNNKIKSGIIA